MNFNNPVYISIKKLMKLYNPFNSTIWPKCIESITKDEINKSIQNKNLIDPNIPKIMLYKFWDLSSKEEHIARISWFVINNWYDPIELDVGIPNLQLNINWGILDGNHRYMAACYRSDKYILSNCSGDLKILEKLI